MTRLISILGFSQRLLTSSPTIRVINFASVRAVDATALLKHYFTMSSLAEIEQAADKLSPQQKQELMLFLGARLRTGRAGLPEPRQFSREQVQSWVAEDEADLKKFRKPS